MAEYKICKKCLINQQNKNKRFHRAVKDGKTYKKIIEDKTPHSICKDCQLHLTTRGYYVAVKNKTYQRNLRKGKKKPKKKLTKKEKEKMRKEQQKLIKERDQDLINKYIKQQKSLIGNYKQNTYKKGVKDTKELLEDQLELRKDFEIDINRLENKREKLKGVGKGKVTRELNKIKESHNLVNQLIKNINEDLQPIVDNIKNYLFEVFDNEDNKNKMQININNNATKNIKDTIKYYKEQNLGEDINLIQIGNMIDELLKKKLYYTKSNNLI